MAEQEARMDALLSASLHEIPVYGSPASRHARDIPTSLLLRFILEYNRQTRKGVQLSQLMGHIAAPERVVKAKINKLLSREYITGSWMCGFWLTTRGANLIKETIVL